LLRRLLETQAVPLLVERQHVPAARAARHALESASLKANPQARFSVFVKWANSIAPRAAALERYPLGFVVLRDVRQSRTIKAALVIPSVFGRVGCV